MAARSPRKRFVPSSLSLALSPSRPTSLPAGQDRNIPPNRRYFFRLMKSERFLSIHGKRSLLTLVLLLAVFAITAAAQVSPNEILNTDLKALEQTYFQQLIGINQSIAKTKFPFPFYLSRYIGLDPAKQAEADSRGLEFVRFQDRVILKITGNYNAGYDSARLTQNERAAATFRSVILPILNVVTAALPEELACDGIGFEISHHTRTKQSSYDF